MVSSTSNSCNVLSHSLTQHPYGLRNSLLWLSWLCQAFPSAKHQRFLLACIPCREKDGAIASLESDLAAAKHRISAAQRAAKVTGSIDTAGMTFQAQSQVEKLEVLNAQLEI